MKTALIIFNSQCSSSFYLGYCLSGITMQFPSPISVLSAALYGVRQREHSMIGLKLLKLSPSHGAGKQNPSKEQESCWVKEIEIRVHDCVGCWGQCICKKKVSEKEWKKPAHTHKFHHMFDWITKDAWVGWDSRWPEG